MTFPVVVSAVHRRHAPLAEIESSALQSPWEHPGRADAIHDVLAADDRFAMLAPDDWGTAPIAAVHDPGLVEFLSRAWADYQVRHPGTHDVVPDVFVNPGLLDGIGPVRDELPVVAELGRWCFETTTPLTEGTYEAARGAVDIALTATQLVLDGAGPCVRPLPPARPSRATGVVRRLLLLQQRRRRRAPRRVDHRITRHGARRRLPPRQRHAADLLRPRRRAVRVAARRPGAGLSVPHRVRRRVGHRARERGEPERAARRAHRRRRLSHRVGRGLHRDRRVRSGRRRGVARPRHVPRRPDLRPRRDDRRVPAAGRAGGRTRPPDGGVAGGRLRRGDPRGQRPPVPAGSCDARSCIGARAIGEGTDARPSIS